MVKTKSAKRKPQELDSIYLLKMVFYLILGSFWLRITNANQSWQVPVPVGLFLGLLLAGKDRFQIDRKLEYAILLMAMFLGFWLPLGVTIVR